MVRVNLDRKDGLLIEFIQVVMKCIWGTRRDLETSEGALCMSRHKLTL